MMTTTDDDTSEERERGTLRNTLPRRPDVILGIVNVVATGAALVCCRGTTTNWPTLVAGASLSSLATIAGIVYADASIHCFFLGLAVFATFLVDGASTGKRAVETVSVALSVSRALFLITFMSRIPRTRKLFCIFDNAAVINPYIFVGICGLPVVTLISGYFVLVLEGAQIQFSILPNAALAIATLLLCGAYYRNRSNQHGNLMIQHEQRGMAVAAAMAFAWTTQYAAGKQLTTTILPVLVGSCITSLLAVIFTSIADAWDTVGSGQFQMVSLDTAALLGYVVTPLLILTSLAVDKYGAAVSTALETWIETTYGDYYVGNPERGPPERVLTSGLLLLLTLATMIGVSLVNMLSPVGAYLMSRAYLRGQHRTRRVGLGVHFQDLLSESKEQTDAVVEHLCSSRFLGQDEEKPVLNIFVTANELRLFPGIIRKLQSVGHAFGIHSTTVDGITDAYNTYVQVLKVEPQWYHVGPNGVGPDALKTASELDLKVAYWSTHIAVSSRQVLLNVDLPNLVVDVNATFGGNFIYLTSSWGEADGMVTAIEAIVKELGRNSEIKYSFSALSNVAREDAAMIL